MNSILPTRAHSRVQVVKIQPRMWQKGLPDQDKQNIEPYWHTFSGLIPRKYLNDYCAVEQELHLY